MKGQGTEPMLLLYTTSGCHLCEQAEALLQSAGAPVETVEIADDEDLLERYGVRIPVLRHRETGGELDWPFDAVGVQRWLNEANSVGIRYP
jgi:hypothetical protein